jgi:succinoglycan biosynthesis transport protein ExoP
MDELTLSDYFVILKRWKKRFYMTFSILLVCSLLLALFWSNYRATATIKVDQPQIAPIVTAPSGINSDEMPDSLADLRISKIEAQVTSPASLIEIIKKFNLYHHTFDPPPAAVVAKDMSKNIKLDLITSVIANPVASSKVSVDQLAATAFTLSFDYKDPQIARDVTNELVTRFLSEDLNDRRETAVATSDFLNVQIKALAASLADQEKQIADFEEAHGISGPGALEFNQQEAASTTMSLQSLDAQIASNEGTQGSIRAQLTTVDPYSRVISDGQLLTTPGTELKALQAQYTTLTAQYGPEHPDVVKVRNEIAALRSENGPDNVDTAALKAQINDVQTNLAAAQTTDGPDNPDVVSLKRQLDALNNKLASAPKNGTLNRGPKQDADNPAYLSLVAQLNSLQEQYKSLVEQRKLLSQQQTKYEEAVAKDPGLEQQMSILTRDHDNAETRYRELKERKMAADMNVQMIADHKGQRLSVISLAELPAHTYPRQIIIFIAGAFLSALGGLISVIISNALSQSIIGPRHLASITGAAPLVTVPHLYTSEERSNSPQHRAVGLFNRALANGSGYSDKLSGRERN